MSKRTKKYVVAITGIAFTALTMIISVAAVGVSAWSGAWTRQQAKIAEKTVPDPSKRKYEIFYELCKVNCSTITRHVIQNDDNIAAKNVCLTLSDQNVLISCDVEWKELEPQGEQRFIRIATVPAHSEVTVCLERPLITLGPLLEPFAIVGRIYDDVGDIPCHCCHDLLDGRMVGDCMREWLVERRKYVFPGRAAEEVGQMR